jgi:hypothetical protein
MFLPFKCKINIKRTDNCNIFRSWNLVPSFWEINYTQILNETKQAQYKIKFVTKASELRNTT